MIIVVNSEKRKCLWAEIYTFPVGLRQVSLRVTIMALSLPASLLVLGLFTGKSIPAATSQALLPACTFLGARPVRVRVRVARATISDHAGPYCVLVTLTFLLLMIHREPRASPHRLMVEA